MSVLTFDGTDDEALFTPISSALANLPNGAGTIAVVARLGTAVSDYIVQLRGASSGYYHGMSLGTAGATGDLDDDDGQTFNTVNSNLATHSQSADNYRILVGDWPAGGAALQRGHWSALFSAAESWTHQDTTGVNGGNRAGPGTSGRLSIGSEIGSSFWAGDLGLFAVWAGTRFADADVEALWDNKQTSDWWTHPAGPPTTLVECTSTTLQDIGASPSTFSSLTGATATAPNPTGWTFDGRGPPVIKHDWSRFPKSLLRRAA